MNTAEKYIELEEIQKYALDFSKCDYEIESYCFDSNSLVNALKCKKFKARGLEKAVTAYILGNITSASWTATSIDELRPAQNTFTWTTIKGKTIEANISPLLMNGIMYFIIFSVK